VPLLVLSTLVCALAGFPAVGEEDQPYFTDVTSDVGLAGTPGFRLSVADVDGNGYPDIFAHRQTNAGTGDVLDKQYLYLNVQGPDPTDPYDRSFIDVTTESGIRADRGATGGGRHSDAAIFADVDNDGDLDLFTSVYVHSTYGLSTNTNDLLLNDGAAHFTLAPSSPFHLEPIHNTAGAIFLDYDNDGNIDLFIGNWYWNGALTTDQLYRGHGDGSFTNVTSAAGIDGATTCIYGIAAWDSNNDGYMDLFAPPYSWTVAGSVPIEWRNNGDGTFTQAQAMTKFDRYRGTGTGYASFGSVPRDYDNDGDVDFFEILTHGTGDGGSSVHSTTVTNTNGVFAWDFQRVDGRAAEDPDMTHHGDHYVGWFDLDNDSLVDFALTESGYDNNRFYIFQQASDNTFSPVTVASGMNTINVANLPPHNVLPLDYDLDGDEDLLVGFGNDIDAIQLWRNDIGTDNSWLTITLEGGGGPGYANRSAIGARIEVTAGGVTQTREVYAGPGHQGPQVPLSQVFGLGEAAVVDTVTVHWPNSTQTSVGYASLPVNRFLTIREVCAIADDPANVLLGKDGADLLIEWDAPPGPVWNWSLYRDADPDPSMWGAPFDPDVTDEDPATAGVQYRDAGGLVSGSSHFYLLTAVNDCGESPLR